MSEPGVRLANGQSASDLLYAIVRETARQFGDVFGDLELPERSVFRSAYPRVLPEFEARRIANTAQHEIGEHMLDALRGAVSWGGDDAERSLDEALAESAHPLEIKTHEFAGSDGWSPNVVYQGRRWQDEDLGELGAVLAERGIATRAAGEALAWVADHAITQGVLDLTGRRIAMLGAGAEMAPTRLWLEAGADVLWLDVAPPPAEWFASGAMAGRLRWPVGNADLLRQPREVLATLIEFADGQPMDIGLYAYAPGQARELRLTCAMNAIIDALPPELIGSATMLVSPTTPTALDSLDVAVLERRLTTRPAWERACAAARLLREGGFVSCGQAAVIRSVVGIQGASYQAAQYLGKVLTAERWSRVGQVGKSAPTPLRVSANTAAITRTRSLQHPVFAAAFGGAAAFGVETMTPRQSRRLNGLLALHDWLRDDEPVPGAVRVHGGIHTLPYPLEPALRVAAAIGFARSPRLLGGLLRGRQGRR